MKSATKVSFDPYHTATKLGAIPNEGRGGINWSYAVFETQSAMMEFDKECNANGYRTRNETREGEGVLSGRWAIQYHHYQS